MLPSFLPFLVLGEGSHFQCWFLLLPTCILRAHELSLLQIHQWLLMAIYDLGPRPSAKQVLLGQEKALGGKKEGRQTSHHGGDMWILSISSYEECLSQEGLSSEIVVRRQTDSFAHNAPNSPELRDHGRLKAPALVLWNLSLGTLPFSWRSPVHWDGFPKEVPGLPLPSLRSLREQSSIMLNFVFQELPLWGGAIGQPCLSIVVMCMQGSQKYRFS